MKLFRREKYISRISPFFNDTDLIKVITGIAKIQKTESSSRG